MAASRGRVGTYLVLGLLLGLQYVSATWRLQFDPSALVIERLDPIVSPGTIAGHVHNIGGGSNFGMSSNFDTLRQSSCTTCLVKQDMSNYWSPMLYYRYPDGRFVSVPNRKHSLTVYYKHRNHPITNLTPFPKGFRMIAGNTNLRAYENTEASNNILYNCYDANDNMSGNGTFGFPPAKCADGIRIDISFPSCWDGVNLDSADHRSHVAYPTMKKCSDPKFPVPLMTLKYRLAYDVGQFAGMWYDEQSPFVLANGDPTGFGFHADFMNGWDMDTLTNATATCTQTENLLDLSICSVFNLTKDASCSKAPTFSEMTTGVILDKLPGCNPVWDGTGTRPTCSPTAQVALASATGSATVTGVSSTARATNTNLVAPSSYKSWLYQGCFLDVRTSRIMTKITSLTVLPLSIDYCLDLCAGSGYQFAGVEAGRDCWCGNTFNATQSKQQRSEAKCNAVCPGSAQEPCGGGNMYMNAYALKSAVSNNAISPSSDRRAVAAAPTFLSSSTTVASTVLSAGRPQFATKSVSSQSTSGMAVKSTPSSSKSIMTSSKTSSTPTSMAKTTVSKKSSSFSSSSKTTTTSSKTSLTLISMAKTIVSMSSSSPAKSSTTLSKR